MLKFLEATGKTEEDAISTALAKLDMERDDVSVEVLGRAKSGFLGIGSCPAKVRVSYEVEGEEPQPEPTPAPRTRVETPKTPKTPKPAAPAGTPAPTDDETAAHITGFLSGLMAHMGVAATPKVAMDDEGNYEVVLEGDDLGALIGRRGETLDAIQQLTSYSVNKGRSKRARIHVDAENYRARREESLERLAQKVAGKVVKYRRDVTLEPMNAYERHVIHTALQEFPGVTTYSTGTEPNRRTVVAYKH